MKQKSGLHKTFYQKYAHTNEEFHNHRYFTQQKIYTQDANSVGKEFVDLPQPFGINNTYIYLRKINKQKLPDICNQTLKRQVKHTPILSHQYLITKTQDINLRHLNFNSRTSSPSRSSYKKLPKQKIKQLNQSHSKLFLKFMLYDRLRIHENKPMHIVQIDIMKYFIGCFLKSSLKLEYMTIEQYQLLQEFIPRALAMRNSQKNNSDYVSRSFLGIDQMNYCKDLILRVQTLKQQNKNKQISALLEYFILPSSQVMKYQMELLLSDINKENQMKYRTSYSFYQYLYHSNGKPIKNLFEIASKEKIIVISQQPLNDDEFLEIQQVLNTEKRLKQQVKKHEIFRNRFTRDIEQASKFDPNSKSVQNDTSNKINQIFQKRKNIINLKSKYNKHNLFKSRKMPFIDKSKLVHQIQLFE